MVYMRIFAPPALLMGVILIAVTAALIVGYSYMVRQSLIVLFVGDETHYRISICPNWHLQVGTTLPRTK